MSYLLLVYLLLKCCKQYWTSPGNSTPQSGSCKATSHPLQKLSKLDEPDMRNTAREVGTDINTWLAKGWTAIDRLLVIWKPDMTDKMKCSFFQAVVVPILLYGCTTWTQTKGMEKKLDGYYTRMLWAILNKSWRQHSTKQQLYSHLPPITKPIKIRWSRHAWHSCRSRDELISDVLLWTPSHGWSKAGQLAWTYIQQLCANTGCRPEDLPEALDDREGWRERARDICANSVTWWWWSLKNEKPRWIWSKWANSIIFTRGHHHDEPAHPPRDFGGTEINFLIFTCY